jgi:UDP-N-acetylglucosamine:LPS N-acetylglucosamine transferase
VNHVATYNTLDTFTQPRDNLLDNGNRDPWCLGIWLLRVRRHRQEHRPIVVLGGGRYPSVNAYREAVNRGKIWNDSSGLANAFYKYSSRISSQRLQRGAL